MILDKNTCRVHTSQGKVLEKNNLSRAGQSQGILIAIQLMVTVVF